jgi:hypothetical protein
MGLNILVTISFWDKRFYCSKPLNVIIIMIGMGHCFFFGERQSNTISSCCVSPENLSCFCK